MKEGEAGGRKTEKTGALGYTLRQKKVLWVLADWMREQRKGDVPGGTQPVVPSPKEIETVAGLKKGEALQVIRNLLKKGGPGARNLTEMWKKGFVERIIWTTERNNITLIELVETLGLSPFFVTELRKQNNPELIEWFNGGEERRKAGRSKYIATHVLQKQEDKMNQIKNALRSPDGVPVTGTDIIDAHRTLGLKPPSKSWARTLANRINKMGGGKRVWK